MATSNHLRGVSELMLVAELKAGFVETPLQLISYATRLKRLLALLLEGARTDVEAKLLTGTGPIDRLDTIFSTQWSIVERPQQSQLIVSAVFDSPWETYFRNLQQNTGALLDAIFMHCLDYDGHSCVEDGYEKFASWIRSRQVQTHFFHCAMPDMTVGDVRYLRRLRSGDIDNTGVLASVDDDVARERARLQDAAKKTPAELQRMVENLIGLGLLFPAQHEAPKVQGRTAQEVFRQAMQSLIGKDKELTGHAKLKNTWTWLSSCAQQSPLPPKPVQLPVSALKRIQGGILEPYGYAEPTARPNVGCLLMVQCDSEKAIRALLDTLRRERLTSAAVHVLPHSELGAADRSVYRVNLGLTLAGLSRLAAGEDVLGALPREFSEGMDKRGPMFGDVGPFAHASTWEELPANWHDTSDPRTSSHTRRKASGMVSLSSVDIVVIVQTRLPRETGAQDAVWSHRHPLYDELHRWFEPDSGSHVLHVQTLCRYADDHFRLGEEKQVESQPVPDIELGEGHKLKSREGAAASDLVPLGELLLGYPNRFATSTDDAVQTDSEATSATFLPNWIAARPAWFRDSSFMALRKLKQDPRAFEGYLQKAATNEQLGHVNTARAWMLGKNRPGVTLVAIPAHDPHNAFDYQTTRERELDPSRCPLHAHVRRANPRVGLQRTARIMRRSFPYGSRYPDERLRGEIAYPSDTADEHEHGLVFMAYNASLAEQFEVVQRWLNGSNITGLLSSANDAISGTPQARGANRWGPGNQQPNLPQIEQPFVQLRWGMYLFVPSLSAIDDMVEAARPAAKESEARLVQRGREAVRALESISDTEMRVQAWKGVIEDQLFPQTAEAVWSYIRACRGGLLPTSYGLLVGTLEHAQQVLRDDGQKFSVKTYRERLSECFFGPGTNEETHYIGLDRFSKRYDELSRAPNDYVIKTLSDAQVFARAQHDAREFIERELSQIAPSELRVLDCLRLSAFVVGSIAKRYLAIPPAKADTDDHLIDFMLEFTPISRYCFEPWPDSEHALVHAAQAAGAEILSAYQTPSAIEQLLASEMTSQLRAAKGVYDVAAAHSEGAIMWAIVGAIVGFAPGAIAQICTLALIFAGSGELERLRQALLHTQPGERDPRFSLLLGPIWQALTRGPVPPILYRVAGEGAVLSPPGADRDGAVEPLREGTKIVVGSRSVTLDAQQHASTRSPSPSQWLFGGAHWRADPPGPSAHGCPGRDVAVSVIAGALAALLDHPNVEVIGPTQLLLPTV